MAVSDVRDARQNAQAQSGRPKRISVLGSTGSIGLSTIDLVARDPDAYEFVALTANRNWQSLAAQAKRLKPRVVAIGESEAVDPLREALAGTKIEVMGGPEGIVEAATMDADWVMAAIVGAAGLAPTLAAARTGATVALANKECLVCAGDLFLSEATASGSTVLPADSEHSAIFQVLESRNVSKVEKLVLTASGGPFRSASLNEMRKATPEMALAHPNWEMGAKITIDSATMMNKGLELIEAAYLFAFSEAQIDVLVHPESIIHSMVAYSDGSVLAQLGTPDMRTPIAHTLAYPDRMVAPVERLDLAAISKLTFEAPDYIRFPALGLARLCLQTGGGTPTVLNAANEVAVAAFLGRQIGFTQIADTVQEVLDSLAGSADIEEPTSLEMVYAIDSRARAVAREVILAL